MRVRRGSGIIKLNVTFLARFIRMNDALFLLLKILKIMCVVVRRKPIICR